MSKRSSRSARREASLTLPQSPEEIASLPDISIHLLLEQYHLVPTGSRQEPIKRLSAVLFPTDGATTTTTEPAAPSSMPAVTETPTMVTQIDSISLEIVIHSAVQASAAAMSEAIRPVLSRSSSRSGSACHATREGRTRTRSRNRGNRNNDSSHSSRSSPRSRSPRRRRSRSPSRRSRARSKSRRSSPRTSLGSGWTATGSNDQPASWMLSRRTKRKILASDYVDFDVILTEVTTNTGGVPMAMKASVSGPKCRNVRDIGLWLQAWSAYAATLTSGSGSRLRTYRLPVYSHPS